MKVKSILGLALGAALVAGGLAGCVSEKTQQANLQAQAKVSREDAEKTALGKVAGGTVKEAELEKEHGKIIWSLDIATPGTKDITEVHVDAINGEIVAMENEKADKD
jgi:uncharacterized membrane protein YkoI